MPAAEPLALALTAPSGRSGSYDIVQQSSAEK
jgi:hypothetical protein